VDFSLVTWNSVSRYIVLNPQAHIHGMGTSATYNQFFTTEMGPVMLVTAQGSIGCMDYSLDQDQVPGPQLRLNRLYSY
jgi:hypothetical protein